MDEITSLESSQSFSSGSIGDSSGFASKTNSEESDEGQDHLVKKNKITKFLDVTVRATTA